MDNALLDKALEMPPNERVVFAELILASIDHEENGINQAWVAEVKACMKSVNDGSIKLLDFDRSEQYL